MNKALQKIGPLKQFSLRCKHIVKDRVYLQHFKISKRNPGKDL